MMVKEYSIPLERISRLETQVEDIKDNVNQLKLDVKELHTRITSGQLEIVDKIENLNGNVREQLDTNLLTSGDQIHGITTGIILQISLIEKRVSELEKWKWYFLGIVATVSYLLGNSATAILQKLF